MSPIKKDTVVGISTNIRLDTIDLYCTPYYCSLKIGTILTVDDTLLQSGTSAVPRAVGSGLQLRVNIVCD